MSADRQTSRRKMSDDSSCDEDSEQRRNEAPGGNDEENVVHHQRRKDSESSSDSSSEEGADDVDDDDDSTSKSASASKGARATASSESAEVVDKGDDDNSSSDTEDDVSKSVDDEAMDEVKERPVPAARKASVPESGRELTRDELELSKRETVTMDESEAKELASLQAKGDSDSDDDELPSQQHGVEVKVDEVSDSELEAKEEEAFAEPSEAAPETKPRTNGGGAEIRRPQFRHSSSSLSDDEVANDRQASAKSPTAGKVVVAEKTQQLFQRDEPTTPTSHSPLPTRANANSLTKIYKEAVENNNNLDNKLSGSTERPKPAKDVTQIYTQSIAKTSTPPASPKPVPSRNKNITQLYTGGFQSSNKASSVSPCIAADKLSPRRHNMATAIDKEAIRQAYEDVRSDTSDTEWAVFKFEDNNLKLAGTGNNFKDFKASFGNEERGFGYIRINTGDEMSKRAKFVFVTWVGPSVSVMKKAKMSTDKALMKDVIQNMSVELQFENHSEFSHDHLKSQVDKAAGARYGTGERAL